MTDFKTFIVETRPNSPFPLVDDEGELVGPFGPMEKLGTLAFAVARVGEALRFSGSLSDIQREAAIMLVAYWEESEFEIWAHAAVIEKAGLMTVDELNAIRSYHFDAINSDDIKDVLVLGKQILAGVEESEAMANCALAPEHALEVLVLVKYYQLLASVLRVEGVGVPQSQKD